MCMKKICIIAERFYCICTDTWLHGATVGPDVFPWSSCCGASEWLACLGRDHQSSVAFIVLMVNVYEGAAVKAVHNVDEAFAARYHQAILLEDHWH